MSILEQLKFDNSGLVPAIAQDAKTGRVLMMAWMNADAFLQSVERGLAVYYSRSRKKLWQKGEQSGCVQKICSVHLDCDGDVVLLKVEQQGGVACHTGRESCFFRKLEDGAWRTADAVIKDPKELYGE